MTLGGPQPFRWPGTELEEEEEERSQAPYMDQQMRLHQHPMKHLFQETKRPGKDGWRRTKAEVIRSDLGGDLER